MILDFSHYARRALLRLANAASWTMPPTRLFRLRAALYRVAGLDVERGARIVGGCVLHNHNITVGSGTWINDTCHFFCSDAARITIGRNVDIGPGCLFSSGTHEYGGPDRRAGAGRGDEIVVGDGTWIGMGCVVTAGTRIGSGCVVAAGTVLAGQYPNDVLIAGVPGVVKRDLEGRGPVRYP